MNNQQIDVAVWSYVKQNFVWSIVCPNENRVRVDEPSLEDLDVFQIEFLDESRTAFEVVSELPLKDWEICWS